MEHPSRCSDLGKSVPSSSRRWPCFQSSMSWRRTSLSPSSTRGWKDGLRFVASIPAS
jgi:hypothetical protein